MAGATASPEDDSAQMEAEAAPEPNTDAAPVDPAPDTALIAPLTPSRGAPSSTSTKRTSQLRKRTSSRYQSNLQKEWMHTKSAFLALNKVYACEDLELLCPRYEVLNADVSDMGDVDDATLLNNVKALRRDILKMKLEKMSGQ